MSEYATYMAGIREVYCRCSLCCICLPETPHERALKLGREAIAKEAALQVARERADGFDKFTA